MATTNQLTGSMASVFSAMLCEDPENPPVAGQVNWATFSDDNYPGLPSLVTEVVAMPETGVLNGNVRIQGAGTSQGWATEGVETKTSAYTALPTDSVILANATGGAFTVTLPDATQPGFFPGQRYTVIKTDSSANAVTVTGTNSQLIGGNATVSLTTANGFVSVVFDGQTGTNWWIWATSSSSSGPSGPAGGALAGTYPNPSLSVPVTASGGVSAFGGLLTVTNSTSAPGNPPSGWTAAAAADRVLGIKVSGDTSSRLLVDSNGKHTWGTGGASGDTDLYRSGVGVLQTDTTFTGQVLTASGLTGATAASRYVGATASGAPGSGTFAVGDVVPDQTGALWICTVAGSPGTFVKLGQLDATATDIASPGNQGAGSVGKAADAGHVHPDNAGWIAADNGWLVVNGDYVAGQQAAVLVAGTLYLAKLMIRKPLTITFLTWIVGTAGVGSSTTSFTGLYNSSGTLLTGSSDVGANFTSQGAAKCTLTSAQALSAGTFVWAAIMTNLATTQPKLIQFANTSAIVNAGLTAASFRWATNGTGLSALPGTITPSSNASTAFTNFVAGS